MVPTSVGGGANSANRCTKSVDVPYSRKFENLARFGKSTVNKSIVPEALHDILVGPLNSGHTDFDWVG